MVYGLWTLLTRCETRYAVFEKAGKVAREMICHHQGNHADGRYCTDRETDSPDTAMALPRVHFFSRIRPANNFLFQGSIAHVRVPSSPTTSGVALVIRARDCPFPLIRRTHQNKKARLRYLSALECAKRSLGTSALNPSPRQWPDWVQAAKERHSRHCLPAMRHRAMRTQFFTAVAISSAVPAPHDHKPRKSFLGRVAREAKQC